MSVRLLVMVTVCLGCAHAPPAARATVSVPQRALAGRATVEVTGQGWAITLPEGFDEDDSPEGSRSFAESVSSRLDGLRVNVTTARMDGAFADFLGAAEVAHAREGMRCSPARRLRMGDAEAAEVDLTPRERTLSLRVFVRAEARGGVGAVVTCTGTEHDLEATTVRCEAIRASLRIGPEALVAPGTIIGRRWVGAPGRWLSVPLEWIDQGIAAPQLASLRSPHSEGEAISAVLISPETAGDPADFVAEAERSMARSGAVENRRVISETLGARVDFEVVIERPLSPVSYRQRYVISHGRVVIVTCGGPEAVFTRRTADCDAILRSLRLGP